jgi:hypothetical protein
MNLSSYILSFLMGFSTGDGLPRQPLMNAQCDTSPPDSYGIPAVYIRSHDIRNQPIAG